MVTLRALGWVHAWARVCRREGEMRHGTGMQAWWLALGCSLYVLPAAAVLDCDGWSMGAPAWRIGQVAIAIGLSPRERYLPTNSPTQTPLVTDTALKIPQE